MGVARVLHHNVDDHFQSEEWGLSIGRDLLLNTKGKRREMGSKKMTDESVELDNTSCNSDTDALLSSESDHDINGMYTAEHMAKLSTFLYQIIYSLLYVTIRYLSLNYFIFSHPLFPSQMLA